jgi:two-component system, LytTR family, sensor kinase
MKKRNIILIHFLYWLYILNQFLFPVYVGNQTETQMMGPQYLEEMAISLFLNILTFYAFYFTFPGIVALKHKFTGFLAVMGMICIVMGIRLPVDWFYWKYLVYLPENEMTFQWMRVWNELRLLVITAIYAILIRYLILAIKNQKLNNELITQRQAGELAILKSQVNPHFLFNTLNNIYSLVYHKSDKAPEAVMKFSSIMRYVLYEANTEKVNLEKEIEYLRSFIELQKLRFKQPGLVLLDISGKVSDVNIAPMILIPFVENAFKYGSKNFEPAITIQLRVENQQIRFGVCNYIDKSRQTNENQSGSVGIPNVRRRLNLIYPGKHALEIKEVDGQFKVNLLIEQ